MNVKTLFSPSKICANGISFAPWEGVGAPKKQSETQFYGMQQAMFQASHKKYPVVVRSLKIRP